MPGTEVDRRQRLAGRPEHGWRHYDPEESAQDAALGRGELGCVCRRCGRRMDSQARATGATKAGNEACDVSAARPASGYS